MKKLLVVDDMHACVISELQKSGFEVLYRPDIKKEETLSILKEYHGILVRSKFFIDEDFLSFAPKLEFVGRAGAGVDNVNEKALANHKVTLLNAPEGNRDAVAEHVPGMLLALMNNMMRADQQVRNGIWDREGNRGYELKGKTVGIIGFGYMGRALAKRLSGFSCNIIAYDKYKKNFSDEFVKEVSLEELQVTSDVISLHIPLTSETKFMVDDAFFANVKKPVWFVNSARGEIVRLRSVLTALESGKIRGAALDVLENEKLNTLTDEQAFVMNALGKRQDVLFSPHVAGWTFESYEKISMVLVDKIRKFYLIA
jgi:D-3-phosphoglycerate dehydrogenase